MKKYAVVDIGSNTIRLAVYQTEGNQFYQLFSQKYTVGLAGYVEHQVLSQAGIQKACETLQQCKSLLQLFEELEATYVFATASLRNVQNTREAVDQIFFSTGYAVEVLSGQEEAYLDYYGIQAEAPLEKGLLFDIGGGSTEIVTFAHDGPGLVESVPVGGLNLAQKYVERIFPKQKEWDAMAGKVRKLLRKHKITRLPAYPHICGIGGTARTALRLVQVQQDLPETQRVITAGQVRTLEETLRKRDTAARDLLLRNCPDRLFPILPGLLILEILLEVTQCETIYVSQYGVREGYLRRVLREKQHPGMQIIEATSATA